MSTRRALLMYFALAFGISWCAVAIAATQGSVSWLFPLMLLGPSLAAIIVTVRLQGARGLRELARGLRRWPLDRRWNAAVLAAPALMLFILAGLSVLSPTYTPGLVTSSTPWTVVLGAVVFGLAAGFFEELGWTGFVTPRLLRRMSWLEAGLILGLPWALWHVLPDVLATSHRFGWLWPLHMAQWMIALVAFRVFMTWVYAHTRSLPLAMLLHVTFTGGQALLWPSSPVRSELLWYGVFASALWFVVAIVLWYELRLSITASPEEKARALPGDGVVADAMVTMTHAITIDTPAERVWPWLAQMGSSRGGWYSWDRIDNGGHHSAGWVIDAYQHLEPGDVMPAVPDATGAFIVTSVEPPYDLVLTVPGEAGPIVSWEHFVEPIDRDHSRLIVRGRVARDWKASTRTAPSAGGRPVLIGRVYRMIGHLPDSWFRAVGSAGHRLMEARHMRGIKLRAEFHDETPGHHA